MPDFKQFATPEDAPAAAALSVLEDLVVRIRTMTAVVEQREADLLSAQSALNHLTLVVVPEAMTEAGLTEFKTKDGAKLVVSKDLKVAITRENEAMAYAWLVESGHGALLREQLLVDLRAGADDTVEDLVRKATEAGFTPHIKSTIHPATLKSLVKELLEKGITPPPSISIHQFEKAAVKEPKGRK